MIMTGYYNVEVNLFYVQSIEVIQEKIRYTTGEKILNFVKDASSLVALQKATKLPLHHNGGLKEASGFFPISLEGFILLADTPVVSPFVEAE